MAKSGYRIYVGDLIVGEIVSDREGPCGIAVSIHCRMTVFLNPDETVRGVAVNEPPYRCLNLVRIA